MSAALVKVGVKVVIYVRVSTTEQATEGYSIGEQMERLKKYCEAMGWEIVETFVDPGYSGGDTDRPGLKAMIKRVEEGGIEKVVVYKLDRLSRSQKDTLFLIEDVFLKNNTDFVSMNENFDTSTPFGRAMIGILAVFAQLEREQIKERMSMGKAARAKEGKWNGGGSEPLGYDYDTTTELLYVNEYEAMQIVEMFNLFIGGMPLRTIETLFEEKGYAHKYGTWDAKAMRRVLRSKVYLGYNSYRGEWYKGDHEPIITEEMHKKSVKLLDQRLEHYRMSGAKSGVKTTYLGGMLRCAHCGGKYAKHARNKKKDGSTPYFYECYSRGKKVKKMIKDPNCKNKIWRLLDLEKVVFDAILKLKANPELINEISEQKKTQRENEPNKVDILEKEIAKINAQISRFMDLYGLGTFTIDQVNEKVQPLNEQRKGLQREIDNINAAEGRLSVEEAIEIISNFDDTLAVGDLDDVRASLESLLYYIELDNEEVRYHWRFA